MRILLINDYGFPNGGVEIHLQFFRQALEARGHAVRLFASSAGMEVGESSFADDNCLGTLSRFRTLLQSANPWAASALRKVLAEFRPEVVHLNLFLTQVSPLILPALRGFSCLYHAHWQRSICPTGTRFLPDGSLCRSPWGRACLRGGCVPLRDWGPLMMQMQASRRWRSSIDRTVAISESLRERLEESGMRGIEVIYYGVPERPERPALQNPPGIAFAGRLVREKGVDVLLKAFRLVREQIPDARLQIAGEGPASASLRALARDLELGESAVFHGRLSSAEMERRFESAWVHAVPSIWEEPFGLVAVEAAMRGTASVVSDIGGLAEIVVDGETGLRTPPGDEQALAAAFIGLLSDRMRAEAMGRAARINARERFSFEHYVERFCKLYRELAADAAAVS